MINTSIESGHVPDTMTLAKVIPIYKSKDKHMLNNYRPISILPIFSKILEKVIYQRLLYNTLFSREDIFAKNEFEIFSREEIFANILFTRKYLPAKISSRENFFPRKFLLAKISFRGNIFPRIVPVPQICRLVGLGHAVYYSIT